MTKITPVHNKSEYVLRAATVEEMETWMSSISSISNVQKKVENIPKPEKDKSPVPTSTNTQDTTYDYYSQMLNL